MIRVLFIAAAVTMVVATFDLPFPGAVRAAASPPDSTQFQRLLSETGLIDVCAFLGCPEPGRIDKILFRNNAALTLTPTSWHFETEVFVDGNGDQLSDHEALAVDFSWSSTAVP